MGKKKSSAQQQQQQQRRATTPQSDSNSDVESPSPVAAMPAASKSKGTASASQGAARKSAAASSSSSPSSAPRSSRPRALSSTGDSGPPPFGALGLPDPNAFTILVPLEELQRGGRAVAGKEPRELARVPDERYLDRMLLPNQHVKRYLRKMYWMWRIHAVGTMLDPMESVMLNVGALALTTGFTWYMVSTIAAWAL